MPQMANLIINDGQTTPVAHTFSPVKNDAGTAVFSDKSGGIAAGYPTISHTVTAPTKAQKYYKHRIKVSVPTLDTAIGAVNPVAFSHGGDCVLFCPERGTAANRRDLFAYIGNYFLNASAKVSLENNESWY
jgi:hypothetical protein